MDKDYGIRVCGIYRHFKGGRYQVLGIARHTELEYDLVIYQDLDKDGKLWARPAGVWFQNVELDGIKVPRFKLEVGEV